jgi:HTH-type transcriptional regulator/antitoxin HigA
MMIRPIRTSRDHEAALARIESLWGSKRNTPRGDEFEVLAALVEMYEEEHIPIPPPDPIAAVLFRMEQLGLTRTDLSLLLGSASRASEILSRKRPLTVGMMKILHQEWGVPAESLLGE